MKNQSQSRTMAARWIAATALAFSATVRADDQGLKQFDTDNDGTITAAERAAEAAAEMEAVHLALLLLEAGSVRRCR